MEEMKKCKKEDEKKRKNVNVKKIEKRVTKQKWISL